MSKVEAARFETDLAIRRAIDAVRRDGARVEAILMADYRVSFSLYGQRMALTVPAGFEASPSVPPSLHGVVPFWGALMEGSIAHDWAYSTRCFDALAEAHGDEGREVADWMLFALMMAGGTSLVDALEVYTAVRIFGGEHYGSADRCIAGSGAAGNGLEVVP